jgi:spermidine/putrescine-binding protein
MKRLCTPLLSTAVALFAAATLPSSAVQAASPPLPSSAQVINVMDVGGALALTQKAIEAYQKAHPNLVSRFVFNKAPAPELPGKLKAQQDAGRVDIDVVLSGTDAVSAGIEQGLWMKVLPDFADKLPGLEQSYMPGALTMFKPAEGYAVTIVYTPSDRSSNMRRSASRMRPRPPTSSWHGARRIPIASTTRAQRTQAPAAPSFRACHIFSATAIPRTP